MLSPTRGAIRVARAAAFGVATLALASGAHVVAGGALPSVMVLVVLALPLTMGAVILTGRRCGPLLLLGSLAAAQVLLHEALMTLSLHDPAEVLAAAVGAQPGAGGFASGPMPGHSVTSMESMDSMEAAMGGVALAGAEGWSVAMMAVHALATVVTALLLARGEQALWQLVARLLPRLPCLPRLLSCGPRQAPVLVSGPVFRPCLVSGGSGLRGPPAGSPATA